MELRITDQKKARSEIQLAKVNKIVDWQKEEKLLLVTDRAGESQYRYW